METQDLILIDNIKQEIDFQVGHTQDCNKDFSPLAHLKDNNRDQESGRESVDKLGEADNKDRQVSAKGNIEQPGGKYLEAYSCVQGYLPNSKVEYLQVIPDGRFLGLDKQDTPSEMLPEFNSCNVSRKGGASVTDLLEGRPESSSGNISVENSASVTGLSEGSNREPTMGEQNTTDGSVLLHEIIIPSRNVHNKDRPFTCDVCGVGFTWQSHLTRHRRTHTGEKPYKCDMCGVGFGQSEHLKDHKKMHTGEKPYKCDMCGVSFASCTSLKNHIRTHTGEKPYKCDVCGVEFIQNSNLTIHKRVHTREKPFKCDVCGVAFARCQYLKNHRRTHTGEKPYKCDVCGVGFTKTKSLKNHTKVHTKKNDM